MKKYICLIFLLVWLLFWGHMPLYAVNWLKLQSTAPAQKQQQGLHGFCQVDYQAVKKADLQAGPFAGTASMASRIGPALEDSRQVTVRKLRLGQRRSLSKDRFLSWQLVAGDNKATRLDEGTRVRLVEATLTQELFPGWYLRLGLGKTPGTLEALEARPPAHYINLTRATNQLQERRFFAADGSAPGKVNRPQGVGCCRDLGVMLLGVQSWQQWEFTQAFMLGRGQGLSWQEASGKPEYYLWFAAERVFAGKGFKRQGWQFFAWGQQGTSYLKTGPGQHTTGIRRRRGGIGTRWRYGPWRLGGEWLWGEGVIPAGVDGGAVPGTLRPDGNGVASFNVYPRERAQGGYVDAGYRLWPHVWLNSRWDRYWRGTRQKQHTRRFDRFTLGLHYQRLPRWEIKCTYAYNWAKAPYLPTAAPANINLDELGWRLGVQLIVGF